MAEAAQQKRYVGFPPGQVNVICGQSCVPLRHIALHSPTGFCWGYGGSGPADLALSILADVLGEDLTADQLRMACQGMIRSVAYEYYQSFKWDVVARWPFGQSFSIDEDAIREWLRSHGAFDEKKVHELPCG